MKKIADFLFEGQILKELPRAGYHFLGSGKENVAEHCFMTALIAFTISRIEPGIDKEKIISMALLHDLGEARSGDLNYVQQKYVEVKEKKILTDLTSGLTFGKDIAKLINEFNECRTREAKLANDADQLSFILELKKLQDIGAKSPEKWIDIVIKRLQTDTGRKIAQSIISTDWDNWWLNSYSE